MLLFKGPRDQLLSPLQSVCGIVEKRHTLPILSNVLMEKEGDRLTGVVTPTKASKFFYNGAYRGEVSDPAFADAFFGIWLSEKSSQPRVRNLLLGKSE